MDNTRIPWKTFFILFSVFVSYVRAQSGCSLPEGVANAEILTSSPYSHGDLVTYRCLSGFTMTGTPSQQCSSGAFSGTAPSCAYVSKADLHEQTVDFTDPTKDNSMMYGMGVLIGVVFLIMMILLVLVLIVICRRVQCCQTRDDVEKNKTGPVTGRPQHMSDVVDRVMADRRANHPPAKEIKGWKPFSKHIRDINTSTK